MYSETVLEEKINNTESLFSWLWELSVDGMRLLDSAGKIILVNDAYCTMVDLPKKNLIGQLFSEV